MSTKNKDLENQENEAYDKNNIINQLSWTSKEGHTEW